jgi:murein DD-endopeptidase / murein LD-carboxypeptidase
MKYTTYIVTIVALLVLSSSCSRKFYSPASFENIETPADEKRWKEFMSAGTEKYLNTSNISADDIIDSARKYLGVPHCMGGSSNKCMDCSGLLHRVFTENGVKLPHNSQEQARYGTIINKKEDLIKGDLVFFIRTYKTQQFITHSGIFTGNNSFIHTSSSKGVTETSIYDPWWNDKFIFGTRIIK